MELFDWDRVTIINTDTAYAKDLATSFLANWEGKVSYLATVKLDADGSINEESAKQVLKGAPHNDPWNNSKVVLLLAHDQHAFPILKHAKNYFPKDTFYVGTDAWIGSKPPSDADSWMPDLAGYIGVAPYRNQDSIMEQFIQLGGNRLKPYLNQDGKFQDHAAEYTVDAIISMAMALARTPSIFRGDGSMVSDELRRLEFNGVTGPVRFTDAGDRSDPLFSILNLQNYQFQQQTWINVATTGVEAGTSRFGPGGIQEVCFGGIGCGNDAPPDDSPPPPIDRIETWVPVVIVLLILLFGGTFYFYRRKKILASREAKAIIAAKEVELNGFRNSVVDMCTAEEQYVPSVTADTRIDISNGATLAPSARWCWRETPGYMSNWKDEEIEGNPSDCWVRYDNHSNQVLECAYQNQNYGGQCAPRPGYTVDFGTMIQTKDQTGFQREVKRVELVGQEQPLDLSKVFVYLGRPKDIAKEPQMVLVPGDIVQISKKRKDGWAYGSKLHTEDEPLCRRLVQLALSSLDNASVNGDDDEDKILIAGNNGWFPMKVTRAPSTDDLAILRKTLGGADDLAPPQKWDDIVDPSIVQKSKPLDRKSKEYRDVADSFLSTLDSNRIKIVRIQRIQNMAMWQSYVVKRKTVIDRDKSFQRASFSAQALARFERSWLWHGTNVSLLYLY